MAEEKVAFVSRFNQTCGVATWTEPIARYLADAGYDIRVFANADNRLWITQPDEPYVVRSYTEATGRVDPRGYEPDIVVVQQHCCEPVMLPQPWVSEDVKKVLVSHHPQSLDQWAPQMYDLVIGFDDRWLPYLEQVEKSVRRPVRSAVIPYPVRPCKRYSKQEMRRRWRLPADRTVVLIYGIRTPDYLRIWTVPVMAGYYVLWFTPVPVFAFSMVGNLDIRLGVLSPSQLDEVLSACDVLWLHKATSRKDEPLISSTLYQTIDSGVGVALLDGAFAYDVPADVSVYIGEAGILAGLANAKCDWGARQAWMRDRTPEKIWKRIISLL